jgi:hypothetical protein
VINVDYFAILLRDNWSVERADLDANCVAQIKARYKLFTSFQVLPALSLPLSVPMRRDFTQHSPDSDGFEARIALLTGFCNGKSPSLAIWRGCSKRG